jgi:tetratricopeptide (TPR) repeat protein
VFVAGARGGNFQDAMSALHAITATTALPGSDVDQLRSAARAAILMLRFGPPELGTAIARRTEELAAAVSTTMDLVTVQRMWAMRGVIARNCGDMPALLAYHAETFAAAERTHDFREVAFCQLGLGNAYDEIGATRDAIAAYDTGIAAVVNKEGGTVLSLLHVSRAFADLHIGDRAATVADAEQVRALGDVPVYGIARIALALWALHDGDHAAAIDHVEFALAHAPRTTQFHAMALVARAQIRLASGDVAGAREDVAQARRDIRPNDGIQDGEADARLTEIDVLLAGDDRDGARAAAVAAANRLRERAARLVEPWRGMFLAKPDHVATFAHEVVLTA